MSNEILKITNRMYNECNEITEVDEISSDYSTSNLRVQLENK